MSHNILIPFYHTFIAVIDAKGHLVTLTECILNNDLSILLIIKLYIFITFAVCEVGYYETAAAGENTAPTCQACPAGSTTTATASSDISDCGKNANILIPIDWN